MLYRALTPIGYNGTRYIEGDIIDLDDASAAGLLKIKAVEPVEQATAQPEAAPAPAQEATDVPEQPDPVDDFIGEPSPAPEKPKKPRKAKE